MEEIKMMMRRIYNDLTVLEALIEKDNNDNALEYFIECGVWNDDEYIEGMNALNVMKEYLREEAEEN